MKKSTLFMIMSAKCVNKQFSVFCCMSETFMPLHSLFMLLYELTEGAGDF